MLNMVNGSIHSELSRFFQIIQNNSVSSQSVTPAAFSKARKKVSFTAFKSLNEHLVKDFYCSDSVELWNGFRLLAVDGSVTSLPGNDALLDYFGKARSVSRYPSTRLSQLYDVCNKLSVDVQVAPHSNGERALAQKHLEFANTNDLILYDRGYSAVWLFILHLQKNINFCARANADSNIVKNFIRSGKREDIVAFTCIEKSLRKCKELGLPTSPIKLRLVRVKLKGGGFEILVTSLLDKKIYPHRVFKDLYHQRWFVEEDYKVMKSRLQIENFSGLSVEAIKQDIHAKVLTKNITALAITDANVVVEEKCRHRKRKYKINFTYSLSRFKDNIVRFILNLLPVDEITLFIESLAGAVNAVRPGRSFVRVHQHQKRRPKRHSIAYKRAG